jgi:hypothetical protein
VSTFTLLNVVFVKLTTRYVINLIMLGILMSQVWYWAAWTKKERIFIRVIVVIPSLNRYETQYTDV